MTAPKPAGWRSKLFRLTQSGRWDEVGVGFVTVSHKESAYFLSLTAEDGTGRALLNAPIIADIAFKRSAVSRITWNEPETFQECCLSFQENAGCEDIWDRIAMAQDETTDASHGDIAMPAAQSRLPEPSLRVLAQLFAILSEPDKDTVRRVLGSVADPLEYISRVLLLLEDAEALEDLQSCRLLFQIAKALAQMNYLELMYNMVGCEDLFYLYAGALEYDPDLPAKAEFRQYLKNQVVFKQVVPFRSRELPHMIQRCFRLQYMRDVLLARILDDMGIGLMQTLISAAASEILTQLCRQPQFMDDLTAAWKGTVVFDVDLSSQGESEADFEPVRTVRSQKQEDVLSFIVEMCNLAKNVMGPARTEFATCMCKNADKLLPMLLEYLDGAHDHPVQVLQCLEVMLMMTTHLPTTTRKFIYDEEHPPAGLPPLRHSDSSPVPAGRLRPDIIHLDNTSSLMLRLLWCLFDAADTGIHTMASEVLQALIDPAGMTTVDEKTQFLECIYDNYVRWFVLPLRYAGDEVRDETVAEYPVQVLRSDDRYRAAQEMSCNLLAFCMRNHAYRCKYFLQRNHVLAYVLQLCKYRDKPLMLAVVRVFRTALELADTFYNNQIRMHNFFKPILLVFQENGSRYNLLNSAVIQLVHSLLADGMTDLVVYFVENFRSLVDSINYVETFRQVLAKYEKHKEFEQNGGAMAQQTADKSGENQRDAAAARAAEEAYFDTDSDESPGSPQNKVPNGAGARVAADAAPPSNNDSSNSSNGAAASAGGPVPFARSSSPGIDSLLATESMSDSDESVTPSPSALTPPIPAPDAGTGVSTEATAAVAPVAGGSGPTVQSVFKERHELVEVRDVDEAEVSAFFARIANRSGTPQAAGSSGSSTPSKQTSAGPRKSFSIQLKPAVEKLVVPAAVAGSSGGATGSPTRPTSPPRSTSPPLSTSPPSASMRVFAISNGHVLEHQRPVTAGPTSPFKKQRVDST